MTTTATAAHLDPNRRHDFILLFDVTDGNPNGDPDAGNLPRVDPETMHGLVTDVAIKRKVRDYADLARGTEANYKIYIQNQGIALNELHRRAYEELGLTTTGSRQRREDVDQARQWMCANFFDIRTFGAVMTTSVNAGQVRGPMQITFARSIDPIVPLDLSITRVAITRQEDAQVVEGEEEGQAGGGKVTEMGRKAVVPYGLYRSHGFFIPSFAEQTGFGAEDLELFWQALVNMWDLDRSASRGLTGCRGLYIFSHDSKLGNAPAHKLFDLLSISRHPDVEASRSFNDYEVRIDEQNVPDGVTLTRLCE